MSVSAPLCQRAALDHLNLGKEIRCYVDPGHCPGCLRAWVVQPRHPKRSIGHGQAIELGGDVQEGLHRFDVLSPNPKALIRALVNVIQRDTQQLTIALVFVAGPSIDERALNPGAPDPD